ncbi:reverse transcriptase [Mycena venus]|uniref:Reverse transcriptase n=1 Tax=Mycena venus TaxID=2733690 RepID=A0A8H6XEC4_9AGAR|nr:reverse transcriptase [Mycena venus]
MVKGLRIVEERAMAEVADAGVESAVWACGEWKAPDSHGIQMASVHLGLYPLRLKATNAAPTPKPNKGKTSPKAYRPVEQHAEALGKPLERLMADRISYEAETLGLFQEEQLGGRPGRNTQQAADAFIHRARAQLDKGMVASTIFPRPQGRLQWNQPSGGSGGAGGPWVLAFLDGHRVTVVIDGKRTVTFRCTEKSAPQGSALSVILFLICINRLLRRFAALCTTLVYAAWAGGFVDDVIFATASKSISRNVETLEKVGEVAKEHEVLDGSKFEDDKTDLLHASTGRTDLSRFCVRRFHHGAANTTTTTATPHSSRSPATPATTSARRTTTSATAPAPVSPTITSIPATSASAASTVIEISPYTLASKFVSSLIPKGNNPNKPW